MDKEKNDSKTNTIKPNDKPKQRKKDTRQKEDFYEKLFVIPILHFFD